MTQLYLKAIHIIFVVTWFAGLFYVPRLFIYNTEAGNKQAEARDILRHEFTQMAKRLMYGITWPSAIITLIMGITVLFHGGWHHTLFTQAGQWLLIKIILVILLYIYHFSLQSILNQQKKGIYKYTSYQLRMWNEVPTILLVIIVMLVVVKNGVSAIWGLTGIAFLIVILLGAIRMYKMIREIKK